jgi:hypothetical protein
MSSEIIQQSLSLLGAIFVLVAYLGHQTKKMDSESISYNLLNIFGSTLLTYVALYPVKIGFLIAESVWLTVSVVSLYKILKRKKKSK